MKMYIPGFWSLLKQSARILLFLACLESTQAGSLQEQALKDGCSQYQDSKTIEPLKKYRHPALDKGCIACHLDCSRLTTANQKQPPKHFLKSSEPDLCLECHAASGKDLAPAHDGQPLGNSKCSGCHDPHSSDTPKRLPKFPHGPYAARLCSACHPASSQKDKVKLSAETVDSLCYGCHSQFKSEMSGTRSRHKLLSQSDRACMECHDPHAANQEYVLKKPAQNLCLDCHADQPRPSAQREAPGAEASSRQYLKLSSKHVHEPAGKSCLICHDAHASAFPKELRVSTTNLCTACHGPNAEKIVQSSEPFPLFNGLVSLPPKTFTKLSRFELTGKYVHEPVNISCAFCHDAHASEYPTELYASVTEVCLACHGSNGIQLFRSKEPFPLFGGKVHVPPKSFDKLVILHIVNGNFGHPTEKHPISNPASKDKEELNCLTCHSSHSASTGPKLLVMEKQALCNKCHELQ